MGEWWISRSHDHSPVLLPDHSENSRDDLLWEIQVCTIECHLGTSNQKYLRISQEAIFWMIKFTGGK